MTSGKNGGREYIGPETPGEQRRYFHVNLHPKNPVGLLVDGLSVEAVSQIPLPPSLSGLMVWFVDFAQV